MLFFLRRLLHRCLWIIQKWYRASVWSQLKLCFMSCQGTKSGLTVNQFLFLRSRLNEVIWWMCMYFMPVRCDNSHWLTVPSLHVTVPCRHVKQNDSFTSTYFRSSLTHSHSRSRSFEKLKISCQKVYCLVFRMRLSLHILWLMWNFRILFCSVLILVSQCVCLRMQIIIMSTSGKGRIFKTTDQSSP